MGVEADAFGTLSFDEDSDEVALAPEFEALSASFWSTRSAYVSGSISHELAASRFRELRLRDSAGSEWTIGATSSSWYIRTPGSAWQKSDAPPVGRRVEVSAVPQWVTSGIESVVAEDGEAQSVADEGFNPFQRKAQPLLNVSSGNVRPRSSSDLGWVYEDWDDEDFSDGVPDSLDSTRATSEAFGATAPAERERPDEGDGFDLESLFLKPE